MKETLALADSVILLLLSAVHLYWMTGGRAGASIAVPSRGSEPLVRPGRAATGIVMLALAAAAWLVIELGGWTRIVYSDPWLRCGGPLLGAVFLLRGVGDFRWLGLFKRCKDTPFARWDTRLYTPLCLLLGATILYVAVG